MRADVNEVTMRLGTDIPHHCHEREAQAAQKGGMKGEACSSRCLQPKQISGSTRKSGQAKWRGEMWATFSNMNRFPE